MMQSLAIKVRVPKAVALAAGRGRYGEAEYEPTDAELQALTEEERGWLAALGETINRTVATYYPNAVVLTESLPRWVDHGDVGCGPLELDVPEATWPAIVAALRREAEKARELIAHDVTTARLQADLKEKRRAEAAHDEAWRREDAGHWLNRWLATADEEVTAGEYVATYRTTDDTAWTAGGGRGMPSTDDFTAEDRVRYEKAYARRRAIITTREEAQKAREEDARKAFAELARDYIISRRSDDDAHKWVRAAEDGRDVSKRAIELALAQIATMFTHAGLAIVTSYGDSPQGCPSTLAYERLDCAKSLLVTLSAIDCGRKLIARTHAEIVRADLEEHRQRTAFRTCIAVEITWRNGETAALTVCAEESCDCGGEGDDDR